MDEAEIRRRLGEARVAHLATTAADGKPHLVPICFVLMADEIFFAVDHKPKRTTDLKRLRNIAANPNVAVLADHYEEDWSRIWWVRVDGHARVLAPGEVSERAVDALSARYVQYRRARPGGPVVSVRIDRLSGWSATTSPA
ncbi:MAG TPA: TIGR03668 family PPOX class F420-dependent oxidoreductase [Candidatus Dormibacteraeota bacterium]|nr:TIGR03668 family PPOX class F420-dependent oxidoreductase [Candidatus Dormibacteraeota bacterium]